MVERMSTARRAGAALAAVVVVAALVVTPVALATSGPAPASSVLLSRNVLSGLAGLTARSAPAASRMQVGISLRHPDVAGEMALLRAQNDRSSPRYHQFLTPAQFAARFGVPQASWDKAAAWLRGGGLSVVQSAASRDYLLASGTVSQVESLFHTSVRSYARSGTSFLANTTAPLVPAQLGIVSVVGLNTLQRATPVRSSAPARALAATRHAGLPNVGALSPQDLWSIYDQPSWAEGKGQSVAIFGNGDTESVIKDLRTFEQDHHLPTVPVVVRHVGEGPFNDTSGSPEWDIDMQAAQAMAPQLDSEVLYFSKSLVDADVAALFSAWVNDPNGPRQANASFGECETEPANPIWENPILDPINPDKNPDAKAGLALGNNLEPVAEQTLRQGVLEGRTLFASTGDTGSSCPALVLPPPLGAGNGVLNQVVPFLNYPAASPYAVAVGGTVLYTDGGQPAKRVLEYAWPFTGGGSSLFISAPDYQQGVGHITGRCLTSPSGGLTNTGQLCRGIPDVAAQSGDLINGFQVVMDGSPSEGGGTSLSSPLWAGMWARVQGASTNPAGNGFANYTIYRLGKNPTTQARDFNDVTVGVNGLSRAEAGWDYVSGWGTPDVAHMIADVDGRRGP